MNQVLVTEIARNALILALKIGGPLLIVGLLLGLIISIFQAATQINEQTLTFIPKIVGIVVTLVLIVPWIITSFSQFATTLIKNIPFYVNQ